MRAGTLARHRVKIKERRIVRDAYGIEQITWPLVAETAASIEPLTGREYFAAGQIQSDVNHRIRIRYRAGVYPTMKVVWGDRSYDILSVINIDERNRELHLMCKEAIED